MSNKKGYEKPEMQVFVLNGDVVLASDNFGRNPWTDIGLEDPLDLSPLGKGGTIND